MNKKVILVIVAVAVLVGGLFIGMGGGGPKPEDTFEQIKAAFEKKDVAEIEKYVDIADLADSVAESDIFMGKGSGSDYELFKGEFVKDIAKSFRTIASSGNLKEGKGDMWTDALWKLQRATGFRDWTFSGIAGTKAEGKRQVVSVRVKDTVLDKEYTLDVDVADDGGVLRVKRISNLNTLAAVRAQDVKAKIEEINKETLDKIAKAVTVSNSKAVYEKDERAFFSSGDIVRVSATLTNNTDKVITELSGSFGLYKEGSEKPLVGGSFQLAYKKSIKAGGSYQLSEKYTLDSNGLDAPLSEVIKNIGGYKRVFTIKRIAFADGGKLETIQELP